MPRPALPARLWLRPAASDREAIWLIVDRRRQYSTGCGPDAREEAERKLAEHIAAKHDPAAGRSRHPAQVPVADVLALYLDEVAPKQARPGEVAKRVDRLLDWWGEKMLAEVTPATCAAYQRHRAEEERRRREPKPDVAGRSRSKTPKPADPTKPATGGARRDLEDLRAAINHHAKRDLHTGVIEVHLPEKGGRREVWLTRDEVARLLWTCWRHGRTVKLPRGDRKGELVESTFHDLRHIARFILMTLYTASRSGAVFTASIHAGANRSFVDLESGIFYRLAEGATATNKRQTPVPIPPRLLAHLRRWKERRIIASYIVEWEGAPIASVKVGWATALRLAGIDKKATPHTLRHTAVTWMLQNGVEPWDVGGFAGMSEEMVRRVYGHHHPDYLHAAAAGVTAKRKAK